MEYPDTLINRWKKFILSIGDLGTVKNYLNWHSAMGHTEHARFLSSLIAERRGLTPFGAAEFNPANYRSVQSVTAKVT